ncbi:MAG: XRE family transcriptional regulator, partial [Anaerolineae bacterium]|nr:XRE family transcriptional regulator [Anaerolineae bacterium]
MMQTDGEETFGAWLQRRRRGLGLTQQDLAQQVGCAPITLRKIEAEERRPSPEIAQRLAECLRVPPPQHAAFVRFARGEFLTGFTLDTNPPLPSPHIHSSTHPPNLPLSPYPIIGREALIAQAAEWVFVKHARLLTLIGPPGVGKTRLSLEVARALHEGFAHGAALVELAPVQYASLVPAAIAEALHIEDNNASDTAQALQAALRHKQQLLLLDNFEHVMDAAPFVAELIAACPNLCCLITSRERLRLRAELLCGLVTCRVCVEGEQHPAHVRLAEQLPVIGGEALDTVSSSHMPEPCTPEAERVDQRLAHDHLRRHRDGVTIPHPAVPAGQIQMLRRALAQVVVDLAAIHLRHIT